MSLFDDFVKQLSRPDIVYLAEIYAAREQNTMGVSSAMLAEKLDNATFFPTFAEIERTLRQVAQPGDIVLTVGAGDVYRIGEDLLKK
jgi:UDP-N-acetylmuramate--alanine ligase